jgi:hypothetical protein
VSCAVAQLAQSARQHGASDSYSAARFITIDLFVTRCSARGAPPRLSRALRRCGLRKVSESVGRCNVEKADHWHPRLLRAGGERPGRHTAESFDEIAPPHSITSSARAMSVGGTSNLPCR